MSRPLPSLHHVELDGLPLLWADLPGPARGGLLLRTGLADETFLTAGTTHLLEHLVLADLPSVDHRANGFVDQTVTSFHTEGTPQDVFAFLGSVTRRLTDPPVERLARELQVLRAERGRRRASVEDFLLVHRYGAQDYGLVAFDEPGIVAVTEADVLATARRVAVRFGAVAWLSVPPPAGLALRLHDGTAPPAPDASRSWLPATPARVAGPDDVVALHGLVARGATGEALAAVLGRRLVARLRADLQLSYAPAANVRPLGRRTARLLAVADVAEGRQTDAARAFLSVLDDVAGAAPVTDDELAVWRADEDVEVSRPGAALPLLVRSAVDLLDGLEIDEGPLGARAGDVREAVSADRVEAAARDLAAGALVAVPPGVRLHGDRWTVPPPSPFPEIRGGAVHRHLEAPGRLVIEVSARGLTLRDGERGGVTVPADRTAGVLCWPDGRRRLVAADGTSVDVEPTLWEDGAPLVAAIDRAWPDELRLEQPARIPGTQPLPRPPGGLAADRRSGPWVSFEAWIVVIAAAVALVVAVVGAVQAHKPLYLVPALGLVVLAVLRVRLDHKLRR